MWNVERMCMCDSDKEKERGVRENWRRWTTSLAEHQSIDYHHHDLSLHRTSVP